jgi:hypothetical protein
LLQAGANCCGLPARGAALPKAGVLDWLLVDIAQVAIPVKPDKVVGARGEVLRHGKAVRISNILFHGAGRGLFGK